MCQHLALFYADAYPAAEVADFFAIGLAVGDSCLALLTAPNRRAVEQALRARGVCIESAAYLAVDTDAALAQWRVAGRLDLQRACAAMTPLLMPPAGSAARRIRAAGDLAPALVAAGHGDDAVAFEDLVHRLSVAHDAAVICAYPIRAVCGHGNMASLLRVSAEHDRLEFPERLWIQALRRPAPRLVAASLPAWRAAGGRTLS